MLFWGVVRKSIKKTLLGMAFSRYLVFLDVAWEQVLRVIG
jgi:hypothetical protein